MLLTWYYCFQIQLLTQWMLLFCETFILGTSVSRSFIIICPSVCVVFIYFFAIFAIHSLFHNNLREIKRPFILCVLFICFCVHSLPGLFSFTFDQVQWLKWGGADEVTNLPRGLMSRTNFISTFNAPNGKMIIICWHIM